MLRCVAKNSARHSDDHQTIGKASLRHVECTGSPRQFLIHICGSHADQALELTRKMGGGSFSHPFAFNAVGSLAAQVAWRGCVVSSTSAESVKFSNVSATTTGFPLKGRATFGGCSVTLQTLAADGTTWVPLGTAITAAGNQTYDLPTASYRFAIVTATAVYASITSVPLE
jgi:hypothetical protein